MKTAEDIIKEKKYIELTHEEKVIVHELVENEEEFEAMKWFLNGTADTFAAEKIEPTSDLRNNVLAHLNQKQGAPKVFWLNGVTTFLFPSEKKFYQYPALQIAAVAVLIVSIVAIYNQGKNFDQELAINENNTIHDTPVTPEVESKSGEELNEVSATDEEKQKLQENSSESDLNSGFGPTEMSESTPAQTAYYRNMSAAEEIKVSDDAVADNFKVEEEERLESVSMDEVTFIQQSNEQEKITLADKSVVTKTEDLKKDETSKKENKNSKNNAPAGSVTTTTTNVSRDDNSGNTKASEDADVTTGGYVTGSAGGVYGSVNTETVAPTTSKPDVEETKTKVSVSDSKLLKKLLFTVK